MAAVWKKPVNGMSPRSATASPSRRQAIAAALSALKPTQVDHFRPCAHGDHGMRTPRGYVPMVLVGDDEAGGSGENEEMIMVRVEMLKEPRMAAVLEMAAQQFGYAQPGVLRIPCGVDRFQQMVKTHMC